MGIKSPIMFQTKTGAADLELKANPGESIRVHDVFMNTGTDGFVTVQIEKTTVGYFRVGTTYGNHLFFPQGRDSSSVLTHKLPLSLLGLLAQRGIFKGYPVAEGETFRLKNNGQADEHKVVLYSVHDAGDNKAEDENGSKANKYFFINYGDTGAAIAAAGDQLMDTTRNPAEFPSFPFAADVPAKTTVHLHGILGKEVGVRNATPATAIYTSFLKIVRGREVMHDALREGIPFDFSDVAGAAGTKFGGGYSLIGDYSSVDPRLPLFFDTPISFLGGEEVNVYVTTVEPVDGSTIAQDYQTIGLIETIERE